jgi:Na+-translocating ferredoxin:NAD+ oxidoreductase RNF subunit RnfB
VELFSSTISCTWRKAASRSLKIQFSGVAKPPVISSASALPGLDCGSCGSPTCRALAEDITGGFATPLNCIFKLRERLYAMAQEMVELNSSTRLGPRPQKHDKEEIHDECP